MSHTMNPAPRQSILAPDGAQEFIRNDFIDSAHAKKLPVRGIRRNSGATIKAPRRVALRARYSNVTFLARVPVFVRVAAADDGRSWSDRLHPPLSGCRSTWK
jgi:hypothetical protein